MSKKSKPNYDIDDIIQKLYKSRDEEVYLLEDQVNFVISKVQQIFQQQDMLLTLSLPCIIVGDLHGQYTDLLNIFDRCGFPPKQKYVFLGDYVDRGKQSIEIVCLLYCYKIKYRDHIFLLRGNHQSFQLSRVYGFYDQCRRKYSFKLHNTFCNSFHFMPACALISQKIFCVHGGISPKTIKNLSDINFISRPCQIPDSGLLCDLTWSDPMQSVQTFKVNPRRTSYCFGQKPLLQFLQRFDLRLVCRAHEMKKQGYQYFGRQQKLVTIFSASGYCNEDNKGAVMIIKEDFQISFQIFEPKPKEAENAITT